MHDPRRKRRARSGPHLHHRGRLRHRIVDEHCTGEIERCKEIEIRGKAQVISHRSRDQAANEIARNIACDIGGECAAGVGRAALLAEVSERECKG